MPLYTFTNGKEFRDVFFHMDDEKKYVDETGFEWKRVFSRPSILMNSSTLDPFSAEEFSRSTEGKNYTVGDMWDRSAELSEKRERIVGEDPVKKKMYEDYKKRTKKDHPEVRKQKATQDLKKLGVDLVD